MGPETTPTPQSQAASKPQRGEFLALRLLAAVGVSVVVAVVSANSIGIFIGLITKGQGMMLESLLAGLMHSSAIFAGTLLLVLALAPWFLFRSVKTSLASEPRFIDRTVYKVTMYAGLAVLAIATGLQLISALAAVVASLINIGVQGVDIGAIYLHQFLPALLGAVVTGFIAFCFWQTDRGKDKINLMSTTLAGVAVVVGLAVLIATSMALHDKSSPVDQLRGLDSSSETEHGNGQMSLPPASEGESAPGNLDDYSY